MKSIEKQKTKLKTKYSLKFYFGIFVIFLIIYIPLYFLAKSALKSCSLSSTDTKIVTGVVINEKNYTGHSPVKQTFFYSYEFFIAGKRYTGNTLNTMYDIGDSIKIKYSIFDPSFNEIVKIP